MEMITRFREQVSCIDLQFEGDPDAVRKAVWLFYTVVDLYFSAD